MERWETADEVIAAKQRLIAAMPGFELPAAYSVARRDAEGLIFAHVNEVGGSHELPAAVLASVCGYRAGTATVAFTRAHLAEAVEVLSPAEPCKAFDHPNLWSWRRLLADAPAYTEFVAVFLASAAGPTSTEEEAALQHRLVTPTLGPGTPVSLERRKWPDLPHYRHRGTIVGFDEHGTWIAVHPQSFYRGDEFAFEAQAWAAQLVPNEGGWWAAFLPSGGAFDIYVDIGTPPRWDRSHVSMIDLDLDVVRWAGRDVEIADRDEFAMHSIELGYPPEFVAAAEATAAEIFERVVNERAPFDIVGRTWLERVLTSAPAP